MLLPIFIFFLASLYSAQDTGFCENFQKCSTCLNATSGQCSWVVSRHSDRGRCVNSSSSQSNSSEVFTNVSSCPVRCSINNSVFGISSNGYCGPIDFVVAAGGTLVWVISTILFFFIVTVKRNASLSLPNDEKMVLYSSALGDLIFYWFGFSFFFSVVISPFTAFIFNFFQVLFILYVVLYCLYYWGYEASMELYYFQYEIEEKSHLVCLVEGREGESETRIDNFNRHSIGQFFLESEPDEILLHFETVKTFQKFFSQTFSICGIFFGFIVAFFGIQAVLGGAQQTEYLIYAYVFAGLLPAVVVISFGLSSDSVLIITNKRFFTSENYPCLPIYSYSHSGSFETLANATIYKQLMPHFYGKNFFKADSNVCFYFYDYRKFIEFANTKFGEENIEINATHNICYLTSLVTQLVSFILFVTIITASTRSTTQIVIASVLLGLCFIGFLVSYMSFVLMNSKLMTEMVRQKQAADKLIEEEEGLLSGEKTIQY